MTRQSLEFIIIRMLQYMLFQGATKRTKLKRLKNTIFKAPFGPYIWRYIKVCAKI